MIAPVCRHENARRHGKDRKGNQRHRCPSCGKTFTSNAPRPLGDMRIPMDKATQILGMLLEGMSIRACERITKVKRDTICDLVLMVGENCERFLRTAVKGVEAKTIEMDELWSFVAMKSRTKERLHRKGECGDSWTWLAIDGESKLILAHAVGQRDQWTCERFLKQLNEATVGRCQVTSDGLSLYRYNVPFHLGSRVDFAQLIKIYASSQSETRYSPATIAGIEKTVRAGYPDEDKISTSYAERLNLSVRMHVRRFTRLTNAHSKKVGHHEAMIALFVAWYNFCRPNTALGSKVSPAMAAGLTESAWSIERLLREAVGSNVLN